MKKNNKKIKKIIFEIWYFFYVTWWIWLLAAGVIRKLKRL